MSYKKIKTENFAATRNLNDFDAKTENIYQTLVILSKRANQIASDIREEVSDKMQDYGVGFDSPDEMYENKEQIEMARHYEQMPKPTLLATQEFLNKQVYYRLPEVDHKRDHIK